MRGKKPASQTSRTVAQRRVQLIYLITSIILYVMWEPTITKRRLGRLTFQYYMRRGENETSYPQRLLL